MAYFPRQGFKAAVQEANLVKSIKQTTAHQQISLLTKHHCCLLYANVHGLVTFADGVKDLNSSVAEEPPNEEVLRRWAGTKDCTGMYYSSPLVSTRLGTEDVH